MDQTVSKREQEALRYIQNQVIRGRSPSVRDVQEALQYRSPRSAAEIIDRLIAMGFLARGRDSRLQLRRTPEGARDHARTVDVPLVGTAPCGAPLLAEENVEAMIPVSAGLATPPHSYFFLRAAGDSMNLAGIQDGDLVLVRQQPVADAGDRVVALIDGDATIKEFRPAGDVIALQPRSTNTKHKPIVLNTDFQVQGVVIATIRDWTKG
jgi:repressor LexA